MSHESPVEFVATLVADTDRAWLLRGIDTKDLWVPKSICTNVDDAGRMQRGLFAVSYWWAHANGLI